MELQRILNRLNVMILMRPIRGVLQAAAHTIHGYLMSSEKVLLVEVVSVKLTKAKLLVLWLEVVCRFITTAKQAPSTSKRRLQ